MDTFSFNRHRPPILPIEMTDGTVIHVSLPTVDLQEELRAYAGDFDALLSGGNADKVEALYGLAARLLSCNRNLLKVTAEDLRKTYHLDTEDLVEFFHAYVTFLQGIEKAKN